MRIRETTSLGLALTLLFTACASEAAPPELDFGEVDAAIEAFLRDNGLEGATAVVVHRDRGVVHEAAYGAFTLDRVFLLASSSKVLSAGILMRLDDQGLLDVDAPVAELGTGWAPRAQDVTVAQMLSNSSGLVGLADDPLYSPYSCQYVSFGQLSNCGRLIYTAEDGADVVPPDTRFRYGGGQWQLAGAIAERVSGKPWAELVRETYAEPCGLDVLGYTNHYGEAFLGGTGVDSATSYPAFFDGDVADLPVTRNPSIEGGGYATAGEYAEILRMHLRGGRCEGGRVLSEAAVARMQEDRILAAYGGVTNLGGILEGYGLGWWVDRAHPGVVVDGGAYGAIPWLDLGRGYGVVVLLESEARFGELLRQAVKPAVDAVFDAAE